MDITTSKPTQEEAVALVAEFVKKAHDEWPAGEDLHFLAKQLEAALFANNISLRDFEEAVDQYEAIINLPDMGDEEVAETLDMPRYREGQRDYLRQEMHERFRTAVNEILLSAGYKHAADVAVAA